MDDKFLTRILSNYENVKAVKKDVLNVSKQYRGLVGNRMEYVFNDGTKKDLFCLDGTIPVHYKGSVYNIPVCIFLMDTHPKNAPICYVRPTADMLIKVSRFVDHNGKVYLPYLHDWSPNDSDLLILIQVMISTFGEAMPVYAKRKSNTSTTTTPYPSHSVMPQPGAAAGNPYMPYPHAGGGTSGGQNFPPYPSPQQSNFGNYPPYMPSPTGYPHPAVGGGGGAASGGSMYPSQEINSQTITEEHIKASLISAVEDKLRRRIQERVNQCYAEIETLNRTKQELGEGRAKINANIAKLEKERADLQSNITVLKDKQMALEKSLDSIEKTNGIDVDEAVTTTAPLYKQLLNTYAEEAATEDAIYYMGEALRNGVIDLEVFLKHVRQLSRKQFMLRALMQKCRQTAGLAG